MKEDVKENSIHPGVKGLKLAAEAELGDDLKDISEHFSRYVTVKIFFEV